VVDNEVGLDKKPYNILTYANGPGFYDHLSGDGKGNVTRKDINTTEITSFEIHQPATAPLKSETHSGADVGIFAIAYDFVRVKNLGKNVHKIDTWQRGSTNVS
ncbi:hypothetical protein DAPPUDRAFT_126139, partial [Daphnia pulex]